VPGVTAGQADPLGTVTAGLFAHQMPLLSSNQQCDIVALISQSFSQSINQTHLLGRQLLMITGAVQVT